MGLGPGSDCSCLVLRSGTPLFCVHAGPSGGGVCGAWRDNDCHLTMTNCTGGNALFAAAGDRAAAGGDFAEDGMPGDTSGDTVQCRLYHLGVAGSDGLTAAATHCPHGAVDGGGVRVDPVAAGACDDPSMAGALPFTITLDDTGLSSRYVIPVSCPMACNASVSSACGEGATCVGFADWTETISGIFTLTRGRPTSSRRARTMTPERRARSPSPSPWLPDPALPTSAPAQGVITKPVSTRATQSSIALMLQPNLECPNPSSWASMICAQLQPAVSTME